MNASDTSGKVGSKLREIEEIKGNPRSGYFWAGNPISFEEACKHFITVGATGAGKSITMNLLMQSVFNRFIVDDGKRRRAVVYDSKSDLVSFLTTAATLRIEQIRILNPFDKRFTPWDVSADILTLTDAIEFASVLLPKNEHDSSPYFADAARSLIAGVIQRFNSKTVCLPDGSTTSRPRKPQKNAWTLRDLILAFESAATLKHVLNHPDTMYLQDHFSDANNKNFAGVKSTVDTALALYRPIAAFFDCAKERSISLKEWLNEEGTVLLLGNHESAREATDTLNRLIFRQLSKFIIGRPGKMKNDETWIFLDELREMGTLSGLRQLLLRGRSKGVSIAMGFQDVEGLYAVYGEHEGAEIIGAAQNAAILHINATAPKTAEWASQVFSSRRDSVRTSSVNLGDSASVGGSSKLELVPNVFPIQFTLLPMPGPTVGLEYFAFTNTLGYVHGTYPWAWLKDHGPFVSDHEPKDQDFEENDALGMDTLKPWTDEDLGRLALSRPPKEAKPKLVNPLGQLPK